MSHGAAEKGISRLNSLEAMLSQTADCGSAQSEGEYTFSHKKTKKEKKGCQWPFFDVT